MNIFGIAIGVTGLALILVFLWMLTLSMRRKRLEQEKQEREAAYRKALETDKKKEHQERVSKAEGGDISTILFLAKEAERRNLKEALHWYTKAAELDNVTGMYGVVRVSTRIHQDAVVKEKSRFWQLRINAAEGSVQAKYEVGLCYFKGRGTTKDIAKGVDFIKQAAKENYITALIYLGDWFSSAQNPQKNFQDAIAWYKQAAQLKSNQGRIKLGKSYISGMGTPPNHSLGVYWLERAAEKGDAQAMYLAGEAWINKGSSGNSIAYIWLFISAYFGYENAKSLRDEVGAEIGVDTIVGLQTFAKPMVKKIEEKTVSKHAIIKVLNKLYKRNVPLQEGGSYNASDANADSMEHEEEQQDVPFTEIGVAEDTASKEQPPTSEGGKLDFSSTPIDKEQ
ncbi:sel1 repeat family protein [Vibrio sp. S4M6]|uniref:tetratricopeptide repeat protein n=1 Tax=Vibrio sinus TaxID=2946865 RepID=UPI002029C111|nr:tetratricopeptide repeat protein [Vibrio sinus]MCL9781762.1 sel1 repeat family protein [Vibrio sinus]